MSTVYNQNHPVIRDYNDFKTILEDNSVLNRDHCQSDQSQKSDLYFIFGSGKRR
jgi:hypothetical protein